MGISQMYVVENVSRKSFSINQKTGVIIGDFQEYFVPYGETSHIYRVDKEAFKNITDAINEVCNGDSLNFKTFKKAGR